MHEKEKAIQKRSQMRSVMHRFVRNRSAMVGLIIFLIIFFGCTCAGFYMNYEEAAIQQDFLQQYQTPSAQHWFGTDQYGRDLFARVVFGGRTSLGTSLIVIVVSTCLGAVIGALAGYYGNTVDNVIMRVNDVFYSIPYTMMAICIAASMGGGMFNLGIACVVAVTPGNVRMFRAWVMPLKESDYIEAARAYGTGDRRILLRHIIPNTLGPIIVQATLNLAGTIIAVAGLSYIGLGVQSPAPEWGSMLSEAKDYMRDFPHMVIFPGIAILVSALALNLIGDGLRDALDPRLKN